MPIGTTNIGMTGIAAELRFPTAVAPNSLKDALFSTCQEDGYNSSFAGNFHCTTMGPATNNTFKDVIGDPYNNNSNMALGGWSNYSHITGYRWNVDVDTNGLGAGTYFDIGVTLENDNEQFILIEESDWVEGQLYKRQGITTGLSYSTTSEEWLKYTMSITFSQTEGAPFFVANSSTAEDTDGNTFINFRRLLDPNNNFISVEVQNVNWPQVLAGGNDGYFEIAGNKRTKVTLILEIP